MKKFMSSISSKGRHSLYGQIILSAFLITNLYPPSLRASMRQNQIVEYPPFQIDLVNERDEIYDAIIDELADYPSLLELFDESFSYPIIDKIMANRQMSWPLIASLKQLSATQELAKEQFQAFIDKLVREQWAEQLLGVSLYRTLLEQFMERYSLEQLKGQREDLHQVVMHLLRSHGSENDEQSSPALLSESRFSFRLINVQGMGALTPFSVPSPPHILTIIRGGLEELKQDGKTLFLFADADSGSHIGEGSLGFGGGDDTWWLGIIILTALIVLPIAIIILSGIMAND